MTHWVMHESHAENLGWMQVKLRNRSHTKPTLRKTFALSCVGNADATSTSDLADDVSACSWGTKGPC